MDPEPLTLEPSNRALTPTTNPSQPNPQPRPPARAKNHLTIYPRSVMHSPYERQYWTIGGSGGGNAGIGASADVELACAAARASAATPGVGVADASVADSATGAGPGAISNGNGAATATGCTAPSFTVLGFSGTWDTRAITTRVC